MPVARRRSCRGVFTAALVLLLRAPATAGITNCAGLCGTQNPCSITGGQVKDVEPGAVVFGAPAFDAREARRAYALIERLPQLKKQLSDHEKRLEKLEGFG